MDVEIVKVKIEEKNILWNLLQFCLYDGSFYIYNELNEKGVFEYKWFDKYFEDSNREAYFFKNEDKLLGFCMVNDNLKIKHNEEAKSIAEFLILPEYRKKHIGKTAAYKVFDTFKGIWEVEPMENNQGAYEFWNKIICEYSNNKYKIVKVNNKDVFIFNYE